MPNSQNHNRRKQKEKINSTFPPRRRGRSSSSETIRFRQQKISANPAEKGDTRRIESPRHGNSSTIQTTRFPKLRNSQHRTLATPSYHKKEIEEDATLRRSFKRRTLKKVLLFTLLIAVLGVVLYFSIGAIKEKETLEDNIAVLKKLESRDPAEFTGFAIEGGILVEDFQEEQEKIIGLNIETVDSTSLLRQFKGKAIVGDSLVQACSGYGYLNDYILFAEIGVSLSTADKLFDSVKKAAPSAIFLCFGINDIENYGSQVEKFIDDYVKRITDLQKELPHTVIYVQGILPPSSNVTASFYQYRAAYNEALKEMCDSLGVYYFNSDFILEQIPSLYDVDGIHPRGEFYPRWLTYMADIAGL